MPPRFKSMIAAVFALLVIYLLLWRDDILDWQFGDHGHAIDVSVGGILTDIGVPTAGEAPHAQISVSKGVEAFVPQPTTTTEVDDKLEEFPSPTSTAELQSATGNPENGTQGEDNSSGIQAEFEKEYITLNETAGAIFGKTFENLVNIESHGILLSATDESLPYTKFHPYKYNPYPNYDSQAWQTANKGKYVPCDGPQGPIEDPLVFPGHPRGLGDPLMGSYVALDIEGNICFERETRLGPYGFQSGRLNDTADSSNPPAKKDVVELVDWGVLQLECFQKNSGRYVSSQGNNETTEETGEDSESSRDSDNSQKYRRVEGDDQGQGWQGVSTTTGDSKSRTAVLIRTHSGQTYTENDKQNIRSIISELALRSGGEYQVFLLVQIENETLPIWSNSIGSETAIQESIPEEFWNMTVLWNDAKMKEIYPLIPDEINNANQSQWLPIQQFAQDHPEFGYYWNWDFNSRYTGNIYSLLEQLSLFAKDEPRKGLWERNERYYIPHFHGPYSKFRLEVDKISGADTVWGPVENPKVTPVGPERPSVEPVSEHLDWGLKEEADLITLAPIFNPVDTNWAHKNDVWGYDGPENTPRRATIGTQSRCSKTLLDQMHAENLKGNHVSSEMTPQTVALLHGFKAVFAPVPVFFDRSWSGASLERFFNPGPKGESGSTADSPFSSGNEIRFEGSTWHFGATSPARLYSIWLGLEDVGIGGEEWEATHGRTCLPPMLLFPIKNVVEVPLGNSSASELPHAQNDTIVEA